MLSRLLKPPPASRRAYSFFSNKPGGGRYFNSAKPPKVVPSTNGSNSGKAKVEAASSVGGSGSAGEASSSSPPKKGPDENSSQAAAPIVQNEPTPTIIPALNHTPLPVHPPVNPHDLKLHQFFSLHRPLLLLSLPATTTFESVSMSQLTFSSKEPSSSPADSFDEPPESSPDADADAARQLSRALVMNRVGGTMSWESTLQRLGIDVAEGREDDLDTSRYEIKVDSTKRKKRRKMKKHKLKKRRRLSRATRIKIGK